ncbi:hypothetical protein FAI40_04220 [Acetobacteraceae bacterium]|nr:hypothetical protein FAI40_04220 [Acetobacteraceae bacterium]
MMKQIFPLFAPFSKRFQKRNGHLHATTLGAVACFVFLACFSVSAQAHKADEEEEMVLPLPVAPKLSKEQIKDLPPAPSPPLHPASEAPRYPTGPGYGGKQMTEAGKIKGYVSDLSHSRGMVEKRMNNEDTKQFAPDPAQQAMQELEVMPSETMNDASDPMVSEAMNGKVPEVTAPPIHPLNRSNQALEQKISLWFNLTKGQRDLRSYIYPIIPKFLEACPTWDSQLSGWTSCQNAIPEQTEFVKILKNEPRDTQIQQWFFLNEMADIGSSEDDVVRAQVFIARYFAEMVEDQLQKEGWCYGPSWVSPAEQSWMSCSKMPLRSARTDAGWGRYRHPANAPKPKWPIPG